MPKPIDNQDYDCQNKSVFVSKTDQIDQTDPLAELEGFHNLPKIRHLPVAPRSGKQKKVPHYKPKKNNSQIKKELADSDPSISFSYNVQRDSHERMWLEDSLGTLLHLGWLSDVLRQVKGGKEASVYLCAGAKMTNEKFLAAKIYRPRMFRNLRNDHLYREGRLELDSDGNRILDHGMQRAIERKTEYGQRLSHTSWVEHEYQTMMLLHHAGMDMPKPFTRGDNAILMEYIGSEFMPAPTLNTINLELDQAKLLFQQSIKNLDIMLAHNRIHADYSAYNILYWEDKIWVIDFPQAIDPKENRNSYMLFERDVRCVCDYFVVQGVHTEPERLAAKIWEKRRGRYRLDVDPSLLDADSEEDRAYWKSIT